MKNIVRVFLIWFFCTSSGIIRADCSLVFIHIGNEVPEYSRISLLQASIFNPSIPIYFLLHKDAIKIARKWNLPANIFLIDYDELPKTKEHVFFLRNKSGDLFKENFWRYTTERFLYLNDFICQNPREHIFHLEYDNMLYLDLLSVLDVLKKHYHGAGITLDSDERGIGGIIYFRDKGIVELLSKFIIRNLAKNLNDMQLLALFSKAYEDAVENLPIIFQDYIDEYGLTNQLNQSVKFPEKYSSFVDEFCSIFDAAAIGQYLGGVDPKSGVMVSSGFINETCCFDCSKLKFSWEYDDKGRKIPFVQMNSKKYRINNIHVHSKKLRNFFSK